MLPDTNRDEHWHTQLAISPAIPFAIRYAGFVLSRFTVRPDGRTPFQYLLETPYVSPLCIFCESVFALIPDHEVRAAKLTNRWISGRWWGRDASSDEHLVGTKHGLRAHKLRHVFQRILVRHRAIHSRLFCSSERQEVQLPGPDGRLDHDVGSSFFVPRAAIQDGTAAIVGHLVKPCVDHDVDRSFHMWRYRSRPWQRRVFRESDLTTPLFACSFAADTLSVSLNTFVWVLRRFPS